MSATLLCLALVTGVIDGDTLKVRCAQDGAEEIRVRLAEIDAPERKQAFGQRAKTELSSLVFGQSVRVLAINHDRYGRLVARLVAPDGADVNFEMVRRGYAWCYPKYLERREACESAEQSARAHQRGLWSDSQKPVAPWDWRRPEPK